MIWKTRPTLDLLHQFSANTLSTHLGITYTEIGEDYLKATMPVDARTVQPMRLLHGGASVALAETLGSVAGFCCLENPDQQSIVGIEINANHLNSVPENSEVVGTVRPIKVGRRIQVWEIHIHRPDGKLVCVSRLTIAVVERR
ncbi:MAG: hotdog fold thioesterase [Bacteroidetes bacterium]|nr:MAG: hotdog fold thioesterase [Bacteroidota bacterium]